MKLLLKTVLLLALHDAYASTRHKATKNAVDEETTQRLRAPRRRPSGLEAHAAGPGEPPVGRAPPRSGGEE